MVSVSRNGEVRLVQLAVRVSGERLGDYRRVMRRRGFISMSEYIRTLLEADRQQQEAVK